MYLTITIQYPSSKCKLQQTLFCSMKVADKWMASIKINLLYKCIEIFENSAGLQDSFTVATQIFIGSHTSVILQCHAKSSKSNRNYLTFIALHFVCFDAIYFAKIQIQNAFKQPPQRLTQHSYSTRVVAKS